MLLLVLGLAAMMLVMVASFISWMRSDAEEAQAMVAEAQSRLALHAALMYLQESSRLGWSDELREATPSGSPPSAVSSSGFREAGPVDAALAPIAVGSVTDRGGETFGWTDVRNGWLGPLPMRDMVSGAIPVPRWWRIYSESAEAPSPTPTGWPSALWPAYRPLPDETNPLQFPVARHRRWPLPGSAVRCLLAPSVLPPHAVTLDTVLNPLVPVRNLTATTAQEMTPTDPDWEDDWGGGFATNDPWLSPSSTSPYGYHQNRGYFGMLDPQMAKDTWTDSKVGEASTLFPAADVFYQPELGRKLQPGTEHRAWFRVYREMQEDHDGDGSVLAYTSAGESAVAWPHDNVSLYDAGASHLRNYSVFIIASGAGGSRGYRFWDLAATDARRALEPVTASESGLFADQLQFEEQRRRDRVLWFRVEWSPRLGGAMSSDTYRYRDFNAQLYLNDGYNSHAGARKDAAGSLGGNFLWIQRLDREPPKW